jgi:Phosphoinositide phospholipase C, Ca2+-dependent
MKYHEVSFKASHNSYERDEPIQDQLRFFPNDPARCGCRGLEFDIWRNTHETERFFTVNHNSANTGYPLAYYLGLLLSWHANHRAHDVILVSIDIKSDDRSFQSFPDEIDHYIKQYFDSRLIFTPAKLLTDRNLSLCENVIRHGWPDVNAMRGKFIFCLTGNEEWKTFYAGTGIQNRYCFSDKDVPDNNLNLEIHLRDNFVFFNMHVFSDHFSTWKNTLPRFLPRHLITRVYEVGSEAQWNKCQGAAASAMATNQVSGHSWAKVGSTAFVQRKNT